MPEGDLHIEVNHDANWVRVMQTVEGPKPVALIFPDGTVVKGHDAELRLLVHEGELNPTPPERS